MVPVYHDEAGYSLTRPGAIADWAVHMRRLDDAHSALSRLRRGELGAEELARIAERAARFYREAEEWAPDPGAMRAHVEENFEQVAPFVGDLLSDDALQSTRAAQLAWLEAHADLLARRPRRDGHGDLRLEHVYLLGDDVVLIDCIEFAERFRVADPALDVAFLSMDLRRLGRPELAEWFAARFAYESDDYEAYALLDGYVSYRAFVRAKVACLVADDESTSATVRERKRAEAVWLFALARRALEVPRPTPLVLGVGGMIGAGKSTVADRLARRWHVPTVSADATRKHLAGLGKLERGTAEIYSAPMTAAMQDELLRRTELVVQSGRSVIVDTTFRSRRLRARVRELAMRLGARFAMVECRVSEDEARQRLRARHGGVSDAREGLLDEFLVHYERMDELPDGERVVLDTALSVGEQDEVLARAGL